MDEEKYNIDHYTEKTSYLLISDLRCEDKVMKFDDCSYNNIRVTNNHTYGELLPYIILSCNPRPGKIRQLPSVFFCHNSIWTYHLSLSDARIVVVHYPVYTLHSRAVYQHDHGLLISYRVQQKQLSLSLPLSLSLCSYELKNVSQLHNTIE